MVAFFSEAWSELSTIGKIIAPLAGVMVAGFILQPADRRAYQSTSMLVEASLYLHQAVQPIMDQIKKDHEAGRTFSGVPDVIGAQENIEIANEMLALVRIADLPYDFDVSRLAVLLDVKNRLSASIKAALPGLAINDVIGSFSALSIYVAEFNIRTTDIRKLMKYPLIARIIIGAPRYFGIKNKVEKKLDEALKDVSELRI